MPPVRLAPPVDAAVTSPAATAPAPKRPPSLPTKPPPSAVTLQAQARAHALTRGTRAALAAVQAAVFTVALAVAVLVLVAVRDDCASAERVAERGLVGDADTGAEVLKLKGHQSEVAALAFSPDGTQLAVAGGSPQQFGGLIVFDPVSGTKLSERRFGTDTFFKGAFAPDGQSVALGSATGAIYLIPLDPAGAPRILELHSDWVMDVAFTPDGKQLVSGSRDKTTKLSSVEDLHLLRSVDQSAEVINAVAADDLELVARYPYARNDDDPTPSAA
jgi:hypothetical protein